MSADFHEQRAVIRAHGTLCTSEESRKRLEYVLKQNRYGGTVTTVSSHSLRSR